MYLAHVYSSSKTLQDFGVLGCYRIGLCNEHGSLEIGIRYLRQRKCHESLRKFNIIHE